MLYTIKSEYWRVLHAAAADDSEVRFYLRGCYIDHDPTDLDKWVAVATDGHRLVVVPVESAIGSLDNAPIQIPFNTSKKAGELTNCPASFNGSVTIYVEQDKSAQVSFTSAKNASARTFKIPETDVGKYPDWKRVCDVSWIDSCGRGYPSDDQPLMAFNPLYLADVFTAYVGSGHSEQTKKRQTRVEHGVQLHTKEKVSPIAVIPNNERFRKEGFRYIVMSVRP